MIVSTATVTPKQQGLDFIGAPVPEPVLYRDGWRFAILYICRPQETHTTKVTTVERIKRLHDAGIAVVLNYEASGTESRYGAVRGFSDGEWSKGFAERIGYPYGLPVMCSSFDQDVRAWLSTARAYGEAFADGLGNAYRLGVYGGTPIINALADRDPIGWKAMARSWSPFGFFPTIHIDQFGRTYTDAADIDTCLTPFNAWLPHAVPDPTPPPDPIPVPQPQPDPPQEHDNVKIIIAIRGYANTWTDTGLHLSPEVAGELVDNQGYKIVVSEPHEQMLRSLLHLSGLTNADLIPA